MVNLGNLKTATLFASVGTVTVLWAKLEGILDSINQAIFHFGGGNAIEGEVPMEALNKKVRFMRRCHRRLPRLAEIQEAADELLNQVQALKQRRHDLVHGIAKEFPDSDILEVVITQRDKQAPRGFRLRSATFTPTDLNDLSREIIKLLHFSEQHFQAVLAAVMPQSSEDEAGSLTN